MRFDAGDEEEEEEEAGEEEEEEAEAEAEAEAAADEAEAVGGVDVAGGEVTAEEVAADCADGCGSEL